MIPYSKQTINFFDVLSILKASTHQLITQGPIGNRFEKDICQFTKSKYCICSNSATSSLILAYKALGLKKNDFIWTTPITFVATSNAALLCDAKVDFVDVDIDDGLIDVKKLEKKIELAKYEKRLPKILTIVHLYGNTPDLKKIKEICDENNIKIVEDASHALGTYSQSAQVGSCKYSDACIFSFHPVKIITTAEGGCVTTNNRELAEKIKMLRSHGITKNNVNFINKRSEPWYYEQQELGFNFRLTDLQSSLGISQLKRINTFINKRRKIIKNYKEKLKNLPLKIITEKHFCRSVYHLAVIFLDNTEIRAHLYYQLKSKGFSCQVHYLPVHLQPYYRSIGFKPKDFPVSEEFSSKILSIPCFPNLSSRNQKRIVDIIKSSLK